MLEKTNRNGKLIHECSVAGETRADNVFPGHANGIPLSRDRWLIVYATRGWRVVDDDRSIVYQVRRDGPDGEVLKEGMLRARDDHWDPRGDGADYTRNQGHPVAFGVPRGALMHGRPAPHANLFVIKWRVTARDLTQIGGAGAQKPREADRSGRTQFVEWMQCRLNADGNDIEIVQPIQPLRQQGYTAWLPFCRHEQLRWMNQTFTPAIPLNAEATEWVDVNHFSGGCVAPLKYCFSPQTNRYEWAEIGPIVCHADHDLSEASVARCGDDFVIAARSKRNAVGWLRCADPFAARLAPPCFTARPAINSPIGLYGCADGVLRLVTGEPATSPYGHGRCPLYVWPVNPEAFAVGDPIVVADPIAEGILPRETMPRAEMGKILPHMGGREQTVIWRVRTKNVDRPYGNLPPVTPAWKEQHGIYRGTLVYPEDQPAAWEFEAEC
jgi:hypothetical protein